MPAPTLCMVFESVTERSAIAKIALAGVRMALDAGWRVTVAAKEIHESLLGRVEWLRFYVPPRGFAVQWLTARRFIRAVLGQRCFDVIHAHQPQVADLADVFQCHFLTRAAYERDCLLDGHGWRRAVEWGQKRLVLQAEDRCYRRWNPATRMLFNSDTTQEWFGRYYGLPARHQVLLYPSPPWHPVTQDERATARRKLGIHADATVLGFLGGLHERKGYRRVIRALTGQRDINLLMGGTHTEGFGAPEMSGHFRCIGSVVDTAGFYAACDAVILASYFEPFGYVASEAAARGIPVVATAEVGALPHLLAHGAGLQWSPELSLAPLVRQTVTEAARFREGCRRYTEALSAHRHSQELLQIYDAVASARNRRGSPVARDAATLARAEVSC